MLEFFISQIKCEELLNY